MMVPLNVPHISGKLKPDTTATPTAHECLWIETQYCIDGEEPLV